MSRAPAVIAGTVLVALGTAWMLMSAPSTDVPDRPVKEARAAGAKAANGAKATPAPAVAARQRPTTLPSRPRAEPKKATQILSKPPVTKGAPEAILQDRLDRTLVSSRMAFKIWGVQAETKEENVAVSDAMHFVEEQLRRVQRQFDASSGSTKVLHGEVDRILTEARADLEDILGPPPADAAKLLATEGKPLLEPIEDQPPLDWGKPLDW